MSEVKVNKISPRSGTTVTLGDSGDTITLASGVSLTGVNATFSGDLTVDTNTLYVDSTNNNVGIGTSTPTSFLANSTTLEISDNDSYGSEIILTNNSPMADNEIVGSLIFKNTDPSGTPPHYAGIRARAEDTFGRMDLEFYASRDRMENDTPDMVIFSGGSDGNAKIGINTSNPTRTLQLVSTGTDTGGVYIYSNAIHTGTDIQSLLSVRSDNASSTGTVVDIRGDGTGDILNVKDAANTALIVKDGGNVGIGTDIPSEKLEVSTSGTTAIRITGGDSNSQQVKFFSATQQNGAIYSYYNFGSPYLALINNGSERMRIDSSGNVLVGKTAPNSTTTGTELYSSGIAIHTVNGNRPLLLNRLTSDGDIIELRQDNVEHGSIGTPFNVAMYVSGPTSTGAGLIFQQNEVIQPAKNKARSNNTIDIGSSSFNFKDLYLGGNIYLGGTGSANALDDYEEGTWTPSLTTGTATFSGSTYVKIGKQVTVTTAIQSWSDRTTVADIEVNGLPFAMNDDYSGNVMHRYVNSTTGKDHVVWYGANAYTKLIFFACGNNANWELIKHSFLSNSISEFYITATYFTNS